MYYILRFLQHACSVIKFVILTIVCRSKSASELMLHCYVYSTLNKSSMSMSIMFSLVFIAGYKRVNGADSYNETVHFLMNDFVAVKGSKRFKFLSHQLHKPKKC